MRVLLSTYGSRGDVEPLVALAVALQACGAEAVVSAPADPEFTDLLARAGVELAPAFMPVRDWIEAARQAPVDIPTYGARMIARQHAAIDAVAGRCDAIVATGLTPSVGAAQCVAEMRGIRFAHVSLCPLFLPSHHHAPPAYPGHPHPPGVADNRELWRRNVETMNALFAGPINAQRAALGLPLVNNVRDEVFTRRPLLASDAALWPWATTDLCDPVQTGAWILPDARPLSAELEAFLDAGEAPVYVGFGSINLPTTQAAAKAAVAACRAHGRRVVLASGWAGNVPLDGGADCFSIGEVNQQALFRRAAAVVHHGGAGTTTAAARAGAPQIVVPQVADQPSWGARVAGLGAGVAHDGPAASVVTLSEALATALGDDMRAGAASLAGRVTADGAETAARLILEGFPALT
jgi:vancomycin aglycone glucosyltransferase